MKIAISSEKKLREIKEEFNGFFPFLTLEFFENNRSTKPLYLDGITVAKITKPIETDALYIFPEMSVADLETILFERFELKVQVLRRSGDVWLKPVHSHTWSLQQQNKTGEIISSQLNKQNKKQTD